MDWATGLVYGCATRRGRRSVGPVKMIDEAVEEEPALDPPLPILHHSSTMTSFHFSGTVNVITCSFIEACVANLSGPRSAECSAFTGRGTVNRTRSSSIGWYV